jgi:short-subunit dehydrogenase
MSIAGKTILITGSSSGIGEQAALQLARAGATLILVARREDELKRVQTAIATEGGTAHIHPCDLTDHADLEACVERILAAHPRIDVLVNNAARSIRRPIVDALDRLHDYERTMQINFFAAVHLTLKLIPRFLEQGEGQVVNISTMSTQVPIPLFSAYLASKSALESFSRSLLAELGDRGIAVTTVYYPMVRTQMSGKTAIYKNMRMMDAERAAGWIVEAVDKRPARVSSPLGAIGSVLLTALPGPVIELTRPFFRRMDQNLVKKLHQE